MNVERSVYTPSLSPRAWDVFWMAVARLSNQEIANTLQVSVPTVKTHKRQITYALGVNGRTGITDWYANNRTTAARRWLEATAPARAADAAQGNCNAHNDKTVYHFLADTADGQGGIFGAIHYVHSLPPLVAAFINCHVELMRLSGVVADHDSPPRPYLAGGAKPDFASAQSEALNRKDDSGLTTLSQQILWARASALGVLAATNTLLAQVNERTGQFP